MKRWIVSFIIALLAIAGMSGCFAEAGDDYECFVGENDEGSIILYSGSKSNLVLPSTVERFGDTYPVTAVEGEAFSYNTDLRTLIIPEGYKSIGYRAFYGCENLEKVVLPSTIDYIDSEAFAYCTSLTRINFPAKLYYAGEDIFVGCDALTLDQQDQDVLAYTETVEREAQQAAFVIDTENLVELSGYLGTDFYEFAQMMGNMEDSSTSDGLTYANDDLYIFSLYTYYSDNPFGTLIEGIGMYQKSNHSLLGVYVSMDSSDAMKTLLTAGWTMTYKDEYCFCFEDPNGNMLNLDLGEDSSIIGVTLDMNYDNAFGIVEGSYDPANVFNYEKPSTALTTGNVKMRTGPGGEYDAIITIPSGTCVDYLGESAADERGVAWHHIRYNGNEGWSSSKYVELME